jgi:hypothetical protein
LARAGLAVVEAFGFALRTAVFARICAAGRLFFRCMIGTFGYM